MKKLFALIGLGLLAIAIVFILRTRSENSVSDSSDLSKIPTPPQGCELQYLVTIQSSQNSEQKDLSLVDLQGTLTQYEQDKGEFVTQWSKLNNLKLMGAESPDELKNALLHKPTLSLVQNNEISHFTDPNFPKNLMTLQLNFLEKFYLPIQATSQEKKTVREKDELGLSEVSYQIEKVGSRYRIVKTWLRYLHDAVKADAEDNKLTYVVEADGKLIYLEGTLTVHIRDRVYTSYRTQFRVILEGHQAAPSKQKFVSKNQLRKTDIRQAAAEARLLGEQRSMSFEEASTKLDSISKATDSQEVYTIFSALKSEVILHPEKASELSEKILKEKSRDDGGQRRLSVLFGALAQSQNSQVANALVDLATSCPDTFCKEQAIIGLSDHTNPTADNASKMLELAKTSSDKDVSSAALLAAGSIGRKLSSEMPDLKEELLSELSAAKQDSSKGTVLAAMGNHGAPEYYSALADSLSSKEAEIRLTAAYSMRYLPNPEVNGTLISQFVKEQDKDVSREVLKALEFRTLSQEDYIVIAERATKLEDVNLQQAAARLLIDAHNANPDSVGSSLKDLSSKTAYPEVRGLIESELSPRPAE